MKCYVKDYPRPQFVRDNWENLNGTWDFGFDDSNCAALISTIIFNFNFSLSGFS